MKKRFLTCLFLCFSLMSSAQTDSYGTEFWTGYLETGQGVSAYRLYMHASEKANVTISIPQQSYSTGVTIGKNATYIFTLPKSKLVSSGDQIIDKNGIHIESDQPITVNMVGMETHATITAQVIPQVSIRPGSEYVVCSADPVSYNKIAIFSTEDSAKIEITLTDSTTKKTKAFTPFTITLNKGESYQISAKKNCFDGSRIKVLNDKKVIAYTGDKGVDGRIYGGCGHRQFTTNLHDVTWSDTKYITMPFFGQKNGYFVKLLTLDSAMQVKVNDKTYKIHSMDSALVIDVPKEDSVLVISGPRKFACFQIMKGGGKNGFYKHTGAGHPSMVQVISPANLTTASSFISLDSTLNSDHYISVLIPKNGRYTTKLDGVDIDSSEFIKIPNDTAFMYAKLIVNKGHHVISGSNGHLVYSYGLQLSGVAETYYYLAGFTFPKFSIQVLDSLVAFNCKDSIATVQFRTKWFGLIKNLYWDFGDGTTDTARITKHAFKIGKTYRVTLHAYGYDNKTDSIVKLYTFNFPTFNPVFTKYICADTFTFIENNPFFANFKWHDKSNKNYYTADTTEKIWVTATDTSGYCKFYDTANVIKSGFVQNTFVDTISNCYLTNKFHFIDSSRFQLDSIKLKVWSFPGGYNLYDTNNFYFKFRQPGKFNVFLDVYPVHTPCKVRITIPIAINWSTQTKAYTDKLKYCNGEMATIFDTSYQCCQKIVKYYWQLDDGTTDSTTKPPMQQRVYFDYKNENPIRTYNYITLTNMGCRDTFKYGLIAMPAALSNFNMGPDPVKCLALARWTFTHTPDEHITGPYQIAWDFGNGKTGTQLQYKNIRYVDTGTYKVKLITTTDIGCKDSTIKTVRAIGNAIANFSVPDSIQCFKNHAFTVKDNSTGLNLNYEWYLNNKLLIAAPTPGIIKTASPGIYKLKLKALSNFPGCFADSMNHTLNVLANPIANFTLDNDTLCFTKNQVNAKDASTIYNGKGSYEWQTVLQTETGKFPAPFQFNDTGKFAISLIVKDSMGCADTTSKSIYIAAEPDVDFIINDSIQCLQLNRFVMDAQNVLNGQKLTWIYKQKNAGITKQLVLNQILNSGNYPIKLIQTTPLGCTDSIEKWLKVLPGPKADFNIDNDTQCFNTQNFNTTLNSIATNDKIIDYQYYELSNKLASNSELTAYKFGTSGNHLIWLKIITAEGCTDSNGHAVFISDNPVANFKSDSVCLGDPIVITPVQTKGTYPIIQYRWESGSGVTQNSTNFNYTYNLPGSYLCTLNYDDNIGCSGVTQNYNVVYPLPDATFSLKTLGSNNQFTLVKLTPAKLGYTSYLWQLPDGSSSNIDTPSMQFPRFFKDNIQLKVVNTWGCEDTAKLFFYVFPPINQLWIENAFTPNHDNLNDVFKPGAIDGVLQYHLSVFNRWGELMFKSDTIENGWDGTYKGSEVQDGVYIFTLDLIYADGNRYHAKGNVTLTR